MNVLPTLPGPGRLLAVVAAAAIAGLAAAPSWAQADCGFDVPCQVEGGEYHIILPEGADADHPVPALLHFHGHGGSSRAVVRNHPFIDPILARGYAVIAPSGMIPPGRQTSGWSLHSRASPWRDEDAFAATVLADAAARFPIDRDRILVTGFSVGGAIVWDIACLGSADVRAFAPIAGAFWRPHPEDCPRGPVDLLHTHGFIDQTVPLEGRQLRSGTAQGDVFESLARLRTVDGCVSHRPSGFEITDAYRCRSWVDCDSGREIQLCLHDGGHIVPPGWADLALDWFESLPANPGVRAEHAEQ